MRLNPYKIVTPKEMLRIERRAIERGGDEKGFMEKAGVGVARVAADWLHELAAEGTPRITLFVGKGGNGGDAWAAGSELIDQGFHVQAVAVFPNQECSPLNQEQRARFEKKKGKIFPLEKVPCLDDEDLLLDGLLGTGFKGPLEGPLALAIQIVNDAPIPVLSIDIPSGVDGKTGTAEDAVEADGTVCLGLAKKGLFFNAGWECAGKLYLHNFGLTEEVLSEAQGCGFWFPAEHPHSGFFLPPMKRSRHKYEAGYVIGFAGSCLYRGAPKMVGLAALRIGAGMVHIFHQGEIGDTPYPLIAEPFDLARWEEEAARASAVCIGAGLQDLSLLKSLCAQIALPAVFDAKALQKDFVYPPHSIFTPHEGEMRRLLGKKKSIPREELFPLAQSWCEKHQGILILKGSPTAIFSPYELPILVPRGDPGMATAGTGDVLTGILAGLLAQRLPPLEAAVLGVLLHALSGEFAALEKTSYGMIATDLIEALPSVLKICTNR